MGQLKVKKLFAVMALLALGGCRYIKPKPPPPPPPVIAGQPVTWPAADPSYRVDGYFLTISDDGQCGTSGTETRGQCQGRLGHQYQVCVFAHNAVGDGPKECQQTDLSVPVVFAQPPNPYPLPPPFPAQPTRDQVLNVKLTFQGLMVQTQQFGSLHMFEGCTAWLNAQDRQALYLAKHLAGDTHSIIAIPSGRPCYDEPNQDFSPDRFPTLDWTNGKQGPMVPAFRALVEEQIKAGFIPLIFLDEIRETSMATLPLVIAALQQPSDISGYVMILPGWDGVFYGWEPSHTVIPAWAALGRSKCPACIFGLEFNTGHIPLGEGGGDYAPGGAMKDFDALFVEFGNTHDDATWQILGRLLGPGYHRPSDQPAGDDPSPPYYLRIPNPRGPWGVTCFEFGFDEYNWVRGRITALDIDAHRNYLKAVGCTSIG